MQIELRFFAGVREALGTASERIELPPEINTVGAVRKFLCARGGLWADTLADKRVLRMAYDQVMTTADAPIVDGGEVAFFPPVTGG